MCFLRIVHHVFPTAAIDDVKLLGLRGGTPDDGGGKPHTSRQFKMGQFRAAFQKTQKELARTMLSTPLPANGLAFRWTSDKQEGGRTLTAKHVSEKFVKVEVDCILKVRVRDPGAINWGVDPDITKAVGVRLETLQKGSAREKPAREPSALEPPAPVGLSLSRGISATSATSSQKLYEPDANMYVVAEVYGAQRDYDDSLGEAEQLEVPPGSGGVSAGAVAAAQPPGHRATQLDSDDSLGDAEQLEVPPGSGGVSAGAVAAAQPPGHRAAQLDSDDSLGDAEQLEVPPCPGGVSASAGAVAAAQPPGRRAPIGRLQKMLQLERILAFLCAKEGKPVLECVAGAMFIGTRFDSSLLKLMRNTLKDNETRFPCLNSLHSMGRLLIVHMPEHRLAGHLAHVDSLKLSRDVLGLLKAVEAQGAQIKAVEAQLGTDMQKLREGMDSLRAAVLSRLAEDASPHQTVHPSPSQLAADSCGSVSAPAARLPEGPTVTVAGLSSDQMHSQRTHPLTRTGSASIRSPASMSAPARGRGESGTHLAPDIAAPHPAPPPPEVVVVDAQPEGCSSHEGGGISCASATSATESAVAIARIEQPDSGRALGVSPAVQAAPMFVSQRSRGARGRGGSDAVLRARPPPVVVDITAASPEESMRQFAHRRPSPRQVIQATADPMHGSAVGPVPPVSVALGAPAPALFQAPAEPRASVDTEEVVGSLGRVPTRPRLPRRGAVAGPPPVHPKIRSYEFCMNAV